MQIKLKGFISFFFILCALIFPTYSFAATFSLSPSQSILNLQTTTSVEVQLNSNDSINVVSAVINYPADLLDIAWIKTDSSAFGIEVEQSINTGQVRISRGALSPVTGSDANIATIGITPKATGNAILSFSDSSAAISSSDMKNILNLTSSTGASFSITPQTTPTPSQTNTPTSTPTSSPAPPASNADAICQKSVDSLKSKLVSKYKDISKAVVRLDTISTLTNHYYQTQLLPKNKRLPGYLNSNSQTKTTRQAALVKLSSLQSIANNLSCANARNQLENFKNGVTALKKDLLDYRQANTDLLIQLKGL